MAQIANIAAQLITNTGTGTLSLGAAVTGNSTLSDALPLSTPAHYTIVSGNDREIGIGQLTSASVFERTTPETTLVGGVRDDTTPAAISVASGAEIYISTTNSLLEHVEEMNQGVATTDSPTFAALTATGTVEGRTATADAALLARGATTTNPRVSGENDNGMVSLLFRPTAQDAGSIDPASTGTVSWGNAFARWATMFGVNGNFTGTVTAEDVTLNGGFLNIGSSSALTIAAGAITATQSHHTVDTEGGAGSDTLETINGGGTGDLLLLRTADDARDVTIAETGNIRVPGTTFVLSSTVDCILLLRVGTLWIAVSPSDNA